MLVLNGTADFGMWQLLNVVRLRTHLSIINIRMIPVFVSCPTTLSADQELKRKVIIDLLDDLQMEPRALGRGDYPKDFPLKEFMLLQNIVQEVSFLALSNSMLKRLSVSVEQKQRNG